MRDVAVVVHVTEGRAAADPGRLKALAGFGGEVAEATIPEISQQQILLAEWKWVAAECLDGRHGAVCNEQI